MKKSWFIAIIILVTLTLLGIGVYFFFPRLNISNNPQKTDIGSLFGNLDDAGNPIIATSTEQIPTTNIGNNSENTTTEENTGARFVARKIGDYLVSSLQPLDFKTGTSSTSTLLMSVSKDGGVVRMYDPKIKETTIVGNLAVPNIIASGFTKSGAYVVVQSQDGDTLKTLVLQSTSPRNIKEERFYNPILTNTTVDSFFIENETIYFIEKTKNGSEMYAYNPRQNKKTLLYRGLMSNMYGYARNGRIFLGTKSGTNMNGFLFEVDTKTNTVKTLLSGNGLVAIPDQTGALFFTTTFFGSRTNTNVFNVKDSTNKKVLVSTWKDKCVPDLSSKSFMFCGGTTELQEVVLPESWYMGKVTTNDSLYLIDTKSQSADILTTTSEQVDVLDPQSSAYSGILTFINKKDFAPWIVIVE